jgi:hypothetical protein
VVGALPVDRKLQYNLTILLQQKAIFWFKKGLSTILLALDSLYNIIALVMLRIGKIFKEQNAFVNHFFAPYA